MLEDTTRTRDAISELASYGLRFSLDDFGVGYSSLGYIQATPFRRSRSMRSLLMITTRTGRPSRSSPQTLAAGRLALMGLHDLKARSQVLPPGGRR
jgi:hypothetical protein